MQNNVILVFKPFSIPPPTVYVCVCEIQEKEFSMIL